jgi:Uncharacterized protein conserved in bacteria (DUF2155)
MKCVPAVLAVLVAAAGCRERGRPDPNVRMAISHTPAESAASPGGKPRIPTRLEVPPEIEKVYSGIRLAWKDSQSGASGVLEVPLGAAAPLPGSSLQVRGDAYLPAFTMSSDAITSAGTEESNPAARIAVAEDGKEVFAGWIFKNFPDVHPFQHPRFSLRLEGGVRRAGK